MEAHQLGINGAYAFTSRVFSDTRGMFVSPFQESVFTEATGHRLFAVAQTSYSVSRRGVVRGVHYTATPPGGAKYVYCPQGRALDFVVDLRVDSPTFGRWESLVLDQYEARAVYFPIGLGHLFVALEEDTVMSYILSTEYVAENELAISPSDPDLALPIPEDIMPVLSQRDRAAPTLAEARAAGTLPDYDRSMELERALHWGPTTPQ
ncbi:dTDP-4-dehydrorhamnose 3,5-epimerase family protein [Lipingzhangella sp. LS1_29]|uniref:dTDP-4-dehydrorhamnose 3,5-epimerase family protein n=1 Tax=Lipingzhangella rawalii TaxID=2055835 RepID=A0ABU2H7H7_9ACTN|nr:dTDP-4-dehydrorhamnose 3,5-epimerase family protein [Lipingzhangella rawalii]MDS1270789.1 dTDP-4-dehydrorhamnose 3,5-epimerase family protein [Lipingzhangella rawalii]